MGNIQSFHFPSCDGLHLCYAQEWRPDSAPRAVLQIVHGVTEHIGRYDEMARFLNGHGILVCGEDHLGHGKTATPGSYGYFADRDGWNVVTEDVLKLRQLQGEKYPGIPYFLLGHSMGSFLTRTLLCRYPGQADGAILSGTTHQPIPLLEIVKRACGLLCVLQGPRHINSLIFKLTMMFYNAEFRPTRTAADWISRDEHQVDCYLADPLCSIHPSLGMLRDMLGGMQFIASPRSLSRMEPNTPVHLFSGSQDPVGSRGKGVKKVHALFKSHSTRDLSLTIYPGGRHEMLHERNRQQVCQDLLEWLELHI